MIKTPETMSEFFDNRASSYEAHMKGFMQYLDDFYNAVAANIPNSDKNINVLDLGCGTGMQTINLLEKCPNTKILALDVSSEMLSIFNKKLSAYNADIKTKNLSIFDYEYPLDTFDYIIATEMMHHFTALEKEYIYKKIKLSLKTKGVYIEADYHSMTQDEFDKLMQIYNENNGKKGKYHIDIPMLYDKQIETLEKAFTNVKEIFHKTNHYVLRMTKKPSSTATV